MRCVKCKKPLFAFPVTFGQLAGTWAVGCVNWRCKLSKLSILGRGKTEDASLVDFVDKATPLLK